MQVMSACFGAIILFELVGILLILPLLFDMPSIFGMSILFTILGIVILLTLDGVMMYVAFRFPVRGLMLYSTRKMEKSPKDM